MTPPPTKPPLSPWAATRSFSTKRTKTWLAGFRVEETCKHIADMIVQGWNVVVTHGNGPQVGFILRRNELAYPEVHSTPLDVIGADTQGSIGYMIAARWITTSRSVAFAAAWPRS